MQKPGKIM